MSHGFEPSMFSRRERFHKNTDWVEILPSAMTRPNGKRLAARDKQTLTIFSDLEGPPTDDVMASHDVITPPIRVEDTSAKELNRRGSVVGFLQKQMSGLQQKCLPQPVGLDPKLKYMIGSCPNLVPGTPIPRSDKQQRVRQCHSTDDKIIKTAPPLGSAVEYFAERASSAPNESTSGKTLTVPDIFVTSKTHSRNSNKELRVQSSSSPDLGSRDPARQAKRQGNFKKTQSLSFCIVEPKSKNFYRDANISQILDNLFLGNIESAYNEHLLCRLQVDRVVDLSNKRPGEVPSSKKSICPCTCPSKIVHSRAKLCINVDDIEEEGIDCYFNEINVFLEGARKANKKVLIHSYYGKSRAATVVIQYLMAFHSMDLRTAYNWVKARRPAIQINQGFQDILEALEGHFHPGQKNSMKFKNLVGDELVRRTAWAEV